MLVQLVKGNSVNVPVHRGRLGKNSDEVHEGPDFKSCKDAPRNNRCEEVNDIRKVFANRGCKNRGNDHEYCPSNKKSKLNKGRLLVAEIEIRRTKRCQEKCEEGCHYLRFSLRCIWLHRGFWIPLRVRLPLILLNRLSWILVAGLSLILQTRGALLSPRPLLLGLLLALLLILRALHPVSIRLRLIGASLLLGLIAIRCNHLIPLRNGLVHVSQWTIHNSQHNTTTIFSHTY